MLFSTSKAKSSDNSAITNFKYLGFITDDALSFVPHIKQLVERLKLKLKFRIKSCLSFRATKATCCHHIYVGSRLWWCFIHTLYKPRHITVLYARVGWFSLSTCWITGIFLYTRLFWVCSLLMSCLMFITYFGQIQMCFIFRYNDFNFLLC